MAAECRQHRSRDSSSSPFLLSQDMSQDTCLRPVSDLSHKTCLIRHVYHLFIFFTHKFKIICIFLSLCFSRLLLWHFKTKLFFKIKKNIYQKPHVLEDIGQMSQGMFKFPQSFPQVSWDMCLKMSQTCWVSQDICLKTPDMSWDVSRHVFSLAMNHWNANHNPCWRGHSMAF